VSTEERAAQQSDEPDEAGASAEASQVILVLDGPAAWTWSIDQKVTAEDEAEAARDDPLE